MNAKCVAFVALLAACSSAPAPERSVHPDTTDDSASHAGEAAASSAPDDANAPSTERAADVPPATLDALRSRLACASEGPPVVGSAHLACGILGRFASGSAPDLHEGVLPGVVVEPGAEGRDLARPAMLAVRGSGASAQVAWGRVLPHDPREAADLAAMASDVLENRAPTFVPSPWPGIAWSRVQRTLGKSVQIATGPRVLVRKSGDFIVVLWLDDEAPLVALHRAAAR